MNHIAQQILMHYGVERRSGRYPWGSGENPYQHSGDFLSRVEKLKRDGLTETKIAEVMNLSTTQLRAYKSIARAERRGIEVDTARGLREKGYSLKQIAEKMGYKNDSSIRSLLNEDSEVRMNKARETANILKQQVDEKGMIDVGAGVERELGVSKEKLQAALDILEADGYEIYGGGVPQATNKGKQTNMMVLCPPGTEHKEIYDFDNVHSITEYASHDGGDTFDKLVYPKSLDSSRVQICYAEEGGINKDGLIELRRGVPDISLGDSHYAQVRILVDDKSYMKGMAVYSDDLPSGVDVRFNTNKKQGTPMADVLKPIKDDPDNPFGSLIKAGGQSYYLDENGNRQLSVINKRAEEGDWGEWGKPLPAQFLAKQNKDLIAKQLKLTEADKQAEFDEICSCTNPTVKRQLLKTFSDECDSAAVHLKAAALPRQKYQVLIPMTEIKDTEIYAPNYRTGEQVALVRFPHGGTFEIPVLTVNNKLAEGKKILGETPLDAVGINHNVAERLSGADFDGDTVMVIPTGKDVKITSTPRLEGLVDFDPKMTYGTIKKGNDYYNSNGQKIRTMKNTQTEMGIISNLITDMTIKVASSDELARAVRHSMVVIDAEKHKLDYKASYKDNGIAALKKKYQGHIDAETGEYHEGASTLLSRAKSKQDVLKRKGSGRIDPDTGEKIYKEVREEYIDKKGNVKVRTQSSTKMAETKDARTLLSGTDNPKENLYADYANKMKAMGNAARKEMISTGRLKYSKSAREAYRAEYQSLLSKLNVAEMNRPRERKAQLIAAGVMNAKKKQYPDMTKAEQKKEAQRALTAARNQVGAKHRNIEITDKEWEAIQAGAISDNQLVMILQSTDIDKLRQRATPHAATELSTAKIGKIQAMKASGYSTADIADAVGVSTSTVSKYINQ